MYVCVCTFRFCLFYSFIIHLVGFQKEVKANMYIEYVVLLEIPCISFLKLFNFEVIID